VELWEVLGSFGELKGRLLVVGLNPNVHKGWGLANKREARIVAWSATKPRRAAGTVDFSRKKKYFWIGRFRELT
jgi:hypothetical protein